MKRFVILIILLFIIFLSSCANQEESIDKADEKNKGIDLDNQNLERVYQFSSNSQRFEIISFYEEVLEYTKQMDGNILELDQEAIYKETILKPFNQNASISVSIDNNILLSPSWRIKELEENTLRLIENQDKINQWIEEALMDATELLPGEDAKIYVFPVNPEDWFTIKHMNGVGGVAYSESDFILFIDPSFSIEALKYTVAHEYHHTVNFLHHGDESFNSVIDLIITEGKADSFATMLYPDINMGWTESMTSDEEINTLEKLHESVDSLDRNIFGKMNEGNRAQGVPIWAGYRIGYKIVQNYIEQNPESSLLEWTQLVAEELIEGSEYNGLLE